MNDATASIRELRTDFRAVKRKIEQHGEVTITDNGVAAFLVRPVTKKPKSPTVMPDYYARVMRRQASSMDEAATQRFHQENRGDC